jgi:hypothetical protein
MRLVEVAQYRFLALAPAFGFSAPSQPPTDQLEPEPTVWQSTDHTGTLRWNVFDPRTGRTTFALSEAQFQTWLKSRYCA